jgi:hypothetical protein
MICDQALRKRKEEDILWGLQQEDNRLLQVTNLSITMPTTSRVNRGL